MRNANGDVKGRDLLSWFLPIRRSALRGVAGLLLATGVLAGEEGLLPAFPGAEGAGAYTVGGRGGQVLIVDTLEDYGPGEERIEGSLRAAIETPGPRIVVFAVNGNIELKDTLRIRHGNLTIAGQSAPAGGICLTTHEVAVRADDVVIRFLRFRPGAGSGRELDAMTNGPARRVILDHCSFSWSVDEVLSLYDRPRSELSDLTVQWCIISESLMHSAHSKGAHGYGGIFGGNNSSWHHNLIVHHQSRNPRFGRRQQGVDFRNNVIYNWGANSVYAGEESGVNVVGNYYKAGPATVADKRNRIVQPTEDPSNELKAGRYYVADNFVEGFEEITADNWAGGVQPDKGIELESVRLNEPVAVAPVQTHSAQEAYRLVLERAGAMKPRRDSLDERIVAEVRAGEARFGRNGLIDDPAEVGGWPDLGKAEPAPDRDRDGIPDAVELEMGLDPDEPADSRKISDSGYSFVEVYLNGLAGSATERAALANVGGDARFVTKAATWKVVATAGRQRILT